MVNELFEKLDGKTVRHDGIVGTLKHSYYTDRFGLVVNKLTHEPNARGKRSLKYLEIRHQLRDDWVTDLTDNIDAYCAIARRLGVA